MMEMSAAEKEKLSDLPEPLYVLFVCTGNTCRSPMAEIVANSLYGDHIHANSAGLTPNKGEGLSENAAYALEQAGYTPNLLHTAKKVTEKMLAQADRVYGITEHHAMRLILAYPQYASKIFSMPHDIADPFGCSKEVYMQCLSEITACIKELFG